MANNKKSVTHPQVNSNVRKKCVHEDAKILIKKQGAEYYWRNTAWDQVINDLRSNLIFNSSLGSKELFHSNMLGMFLQQGESDDVLLSYLADELAKWIGPKTDGNDRKKYRVVSVFREYQNFDLLIAFLEESQYELLKNDNAGLLLLEQLRGASAPLSLKCVGENVLQSKWDEILRAFMECCQFTVIENKFKAIPNKNQLEEYHNKVCKGLKFIYGAGKNNVKINEQNTTFYLLAPHYSLQVFTHNFTEIPEPWNLASYENFSDIMGFVAQFKRSKAKDAFTLQYVKDYGSLIRKLMLMTRRKISDPIEEEGAVFPDESFAQKLESIRLRDFYEKLWFSAMVNKMREFVIDKKDVRVEPESGYGHESGLMGYKCFLLDGSDIVYGGQIQNRQFRFYVEPSPKKGCKWANFDGDEFQDKLNQVKYDTLLELKFAGIDKACTVRELENAMPTKVVLGDEVLAESENHPQKLLSFGDFKYVYVEIADDVTQNQLSDLIKVALDKLDGMVRQERELFKVSLKN
ncbi:hypothetical protein [uncultured Fibrobacter sp.]|uniref:hypothetical protein n=1 Tax=uncultured Fibrobacter sp. TaxID=261512 RepID=UPI0025DAC44F|nr:hypothetical protein [uncultured Fibrobacter sp.]